MCVCVCVCVCVSECVYIDSLFKANAITVTFVAENNVIIH